MSVKIRFGTDGWRGLIAEDYTFGNVRRCAQGFAAYLLAQGYREEGIVVGYDKRFHSENCASACAEVLAANGLRVYLTDGPTPTPVISYSVVARQAVGAINITASHNPPTDNGFKVRDKNGGAIDPDGLKDIEDRIPESEEDIKRIPLKQGLDDGRIQHFDPAPAYIEQRVPPAPRNTAGAGWRLRSSRSAPSRCIRLALPRPSGRATSSPSI